MTITAERFTARPVSFPGTARSEWVKFRGLASNLVLVGFTLLLLVGNGIAMPLAYVFRDRSSPKADYDPYAEMIVDKTGYVGVVLVVLAALVIANEYRSGQIKTSFLAVPTRIPILAAKALVVAGVSFTVGILSAGLGLAVAPGILGSGGYAYELSTADAVRLVLGSGLYLATLSAIGITIGALLRNVVASVLAVLVLLLVVPIVPQMFSPAGATITAVFPIQAGSLLLARADAGAFGPWTGYLILLIWSAALLVVAASVVRRRDA